MRVVSLVPAGTEIAHALGAARELVGVTHDCDYPPQVRTIPRMTRSTIVAGAASGAIDAAVRAAAASGDSTFHLDADALAAARPDVILGQTLCSVCAVTVAQMPATSDAEAVIVPLDGGSLAGILDDVRRVGDALGREGQAAALVASLEARMEAVWQQVADARRPGVVCLEWLDPLFTAGHWVPEQVDLAGGRDLFGTPGVPSTDIPMERLFDADPEYLFLVPCGFDAPRAVEESATLRSQAGWAELRAVRERKVYALDGSRYFSRPGPSVVDGIEILASILHPDRAPARAEFLAVR